MSTYTTSAPHADQTRPEEVEPASRTSRSDERGIALQTVIIIVVLLAIAASVAAVLFSRANEATEQLEAAPVSISPYSARNSGQCTRLGGSWVNAGADATDLVRLKDAGREFATVVAANTAGWCDPP